jgi:hypothetical protein
VSSETLVSILTAAFFSRDRETSSLSILVGSWQSVKTELLPLLPSEIKSAFGHSLVSALRESLLNSSSGLQPRKLARHICTLLALIEAKRVSISPFGNCPYQNPLHIALYAVGLLDETSLYEISLANDLSSSRRILSCFAEINSIWRGDGGFQDDLGQGSGEGSVEHCCGDGNDSEDLLSSLLTLIPPVESSMGALFYNTTLCIFCAIYRDANSWYRTIVHFEVLLICDVINCLGASKLDRVTTSRLRRTILQGFCNLSAEAIEKVLEILDV